MKKIVFMILLLGASVFALENRTVLEGKLLSKACVTQGNLSHCDLKEYEEGEIVLHTQGSKMIYALDVNADVEKFFVEKAIANGKVKISSHLLSEAEKMDDSQWHIKHDDFVSKTTSKFSKALANSNKIAFKEGFVTSKACAQEGIFKDCELSTYEKSDMVLYVHNENKIYSFSMNHDTKLALMKKAINTNKVKMFGKIDTKNEIITVAGLSVPPGAAKSFFKGCL